MVATKRIYWIPFVLLFMLIFDGVFANLFSNWLINSGNTLIPRMVVIALVILAFKLDSKRLWIMAIFIGLMYDSYFTGILGIYFALFPLTVRIISSIKYSIHVNAFTIGLAVIVVLTLIETVVYLFYTFIDYTSLGWQQFVLTHLAPTLVLNIVLYYILYMPLQKIAKWVGVGDYVPKHLN